MLIINVYLSLALLGEKVITFCLALNQLLSNSSCVLHPLRSLPSQRFYLT